jgi:putative SOS response-associated peptidase YedK
MCGRINVIDSPQLQEICENLEIELWPDKQETGRFKRATNPISIVHSDGHQRIMSNAIWWLLLEPTETSFKPSTYTSFNTRYDKLDVPRSAGFKAYKETRCIIPVVGFGETEFKQGKPLHYHDMTPVSGGLLLGGLYRYWVNKHTGERQMSCSVITLPPHPKLANIHTKASPLMLPFDKPIIDTWLSPEVTDTKVFDHLLQPHIPTDLVAQQIDKPGKFQPVGASFIIPKDAA